MSTTCTRDILLRPLGDTYIWDCPLCEYTQGPTYDPQETIICGDCDTEWTLYVPPEPVYTETRKANGGTMWSWGFEKATPEEMADSGWSFSSEPADIRLNEARSTESSWSFDISIRGTLEELTPDPNITYRAVVSRDRLLTLPED